MAATALPQRLSLYILLLPLATPWVSAAANDCPHLKCFYNSRANVSCMWSPEEAIQGMSCHIQVKSNIRTWNKTCDLFLVKQASWACNLILGPPDSQPLNSVDFFNMTMECQEGKGWRRVRTCNFHPFENLRLMAPHSLQVLHIETQRCNISWEVSQVSHYVDKDLEFEVRMRSLGHSWKDAPLLSLKQRQQWIHLETLTPDTSYELQVRVLAQRGDHRTWSPWSQPLAFRTRPAGPWRETLPLLWLRHLLLILGCLFGFLLCVYVLVKCQYLGPWPAAIMRCTVGTAIRGVFTRRPGSCLPLWRVCGLSHARAIYWRVLSSGSTGLKTVLKCHVPDPSEFFSQHGGDLQKWLSSPFPSSSFSPTGSAPEISPLEVLDGDTKAMQLLLLQRDTAPSPSPSGHSQASCFTNQGYFFFHLPNALEIEPCQVYFTYDPCMEEDVEEDGPGPPQGSPLPSLLPLAGEEDEYCELPPRDDMLLFSPSLSSPDSASGGVVVPEEKPPLSPQEELPLLPSPDLMGSPCPPELVLGGDGEGLCAHGSGEQADVPEDSPCGQAQDRALASVLSLNTDAYLSLQELQAQDPAHLV